MKDLKIRKNIVAVLAMMEIVFFNLISASAQWNCDNY